MKIRTEATQTGQRGMHAVRTYCEKEGLIFQAEPSEDYGVDCWIEVVVDAHPTNFLVGIQSKAGASYKRGEDADHFTLLATDEDVAYWMAANLPIILCYYDVEADVLYWRHIQAHVVEQSSIRRIIFSKATDRADRGLADYLRGLVAKTPNVRSRVEVYSSPPTLRVNGSAASLDTFTTASLIDVSALFAPAEAGDTGWIHPCESLVLGYDASGRHVATLELEHVGQMCSEVHVQVYDREGLNVSRVALYETVDFENENGPRLSAATLTERIGEAQTLLADYDIRQPAFARAFGLWALPEQISIDLEFGAERFALEVRHLRGRDAFIARNSKYMPERTAEIVLERLLPGVSPFVVAKRLQHPVSVAASAGGAVISVGILRNEENSCTGNTDVQLFHLPLGELRQALANCLLT